MSYEFNQNTLKSKKLIFDSSNDELPSLYHFVFRKSKTNAIDGFLRIRAYKESNSISLIPEPRKVYETYYGSTGLELKTYLIYGVNNWLPLLGIAVNTARTVDECATEVTQTRHVSCTGDSSNDPTVCTFYSKKIVRYRCTYTGGTPGENQEMQPDETGGGWYEYEEQETFFQNQSIMDSLQGYPCAQEILREIPSCNGEVGKILDSVFNMQEDVNLVFKVDPSLTKTSLTNGYALPPDTATSSIYYQKIFLNSWVLQNSSKEYIAGTMLHEGIHAYVDYWFSRYTTKQIDSNTFKQMFPIFWNPKRPLSNSELQHHNEIANNYVGIITRFLKQHNPNINDAMATSLAWKGLQFTTAWQARSDTNSIKQLGSLARRDFDSTSYINYGLKKCN